MGGTDGGWWDDDQLMVLVAEVLDGEAPSSTSAQPEAPTELSLADVVAAGRAAFCWLDVVVWLRNVDRHQASVTGASTTREPGH
jgi:hypothetical protein